MDIKCPPYLDWFHGGLQFQAEHHLWPRLPRHELRYAQILVKEYCKENDVVYNELPWIEAQVQLIASMKETAMKARRCYMDDSPESMELRKGVEGNTIFDALDASIRG